eukprot:TRINITY_DN3576_c0_g1_i2.p1 TRINITY_DN3576_c0_g1~~TRINITY_DN3576_c0_g1_i2.p1  ORF type:complete len:289 (-),score=74.45 TRINITY_DN3576_c0_g1_i2:130-996(-)
MRIFASRTPTATFEELRKQAIEWEEKVKRALSNAVPTTTLNQIMSVVESKLEAFEKRNFGDGSDLRIDGKSRRKKVKFSDPPTSISLSPHQGSEISELGQQDLYGLSYSAGVAQFPRAGVAQLSPVSHPQVPSQVPSITSSFHGYPPSAVNYPAAGYSPSAAGYSPSAVGRPATGFGHPAAGFGHPAAGYSPSAAGYPVAPLFVGYPVGSSTNVGVGHPTNVGVGNPTAGHFRDEQVLSQQIPPHFSFIGSRDSLLFQTNLVIINLGIRGLEIAVLSLTNVEADVIDA